jgi:hypothetical protein
LEHAAQEALENMPEDELDEDDTKPLFIPFPGTTKQLQPQPYRGSDPEWQEFIRFSKDQAQAKRVRGEIFPRQYLRQLLNGGRWVGRICEDSRRETSGLDDALWEGDEVKKILAWCGLSPACPTRIRSIGVGHSLLRPDEYSWQLWSIEITDDYIAWAQVPVDSLTVFRIRQAMWPSALVKSFWSFTKVMVVDDVKRIAGMLGISQTPPPPLEQILARHQQLIKGPAPTKDGPPARPQAVGDATKAITGAAAPEKSAMTGKGSEEMESSPGTRTAMAFHAHFFRAIMAFKTKLSQTWRPAPNYPPRGSILVSGFVELDSPKAWLVFDVKAAWDPKTREYDARSMHLQLRRMQLKKQGPAGGAWG